MIALSALVVGLSGQEVEETGALLAEAALAAGLEVRALTMRPVARRGASMRCHLRIAGRPVATPLVPEGEADLLLALERLEALRWVHEVGPGGLVLLADRDVPTPRGRLGLEAPPPDLPARLSARVPRVAEVPAGRLAEGPGGPAAPGAVLLGVAAPLLPFPAEAWEWALRRRLSGAVQAAWRAGLERGRLHFEALPEAVRRPPGIRAA